MSRMAIASLEAVLGCHKENIVRHHKNRREGGKDGNALIVTLFFTLKVYSIEQEIVSLVNRVSHPNLTHYLAVNVQESTPSVKIQVTVNGTNLNAECYM